VSTPPDRNVRRLFLIAKSNFRNGGANLQVCLDSPQGIATISEITFGKQSMRKILERTFYLNRAQFW
jgi:hypothetical protein